MSPQATISSGGFLDDNNLRSVAATAPAAVALLQIAWERSQRFDTLAGIQINLSKTVCFGNTPQVRKLICNQFCIEPFNLKLVNSFLLVGGMITTHGRTDKIAREKRVNKALARLKRGRYAPLAFNQRVQMIQTAILPVALYGCELHPLNKTEKESLRRRVSSCLYKGHYWCRSPAANFSFALPGHRLDAVQATIYHTLHVARRIFQRRPELFLYYENFFSNICLRVIQALAPSTTCSVWLHNLNANGLRPQFCFTKPEYLSISSPPVANGPTLSEVFFVIWYGQKRLSRIDST